MPVASRVPSPLFDTAVSALVLAALAACGGGQSASTTAPPPVAGLSGTVAVGAPITGGVLRILDASGAVVAQDIAIDANGHYTVPDVTGTAPWRLEACGYAGANWRCIYSVAQALGTANVTPLTTAQVALATGQSPDGLMDGSATLPSADALAAAQQQLQAGLASTLTDAGVDGNIDFTTSALDAGSRTGYDRVLDAVSVSTGTDDGAFVQLSPRMGDGNVYMTPGNSQGTIVPAAGAKDLSLSGVETLFNGISAAMASSAACTSGATAVRQWIADDARMNVGDGGTMHGGDQVAAGLCQMFNGGGEQGGRDDETLWGSRLVSPVLGHCDFTGADPICGVSLALQGPDGAVRNLGSGISVVSHANAWKLFGDATPISINAGAAVQRSHMISTGTEFYSRALQFDIAATSGVACAQVVQRDPGGNSTTVAYFKLHDVGANRMSLWLQDSMNGPQPSLDPAVGSTRSDDDTWVQLPEGTVGDDTIRNFYRGGRFVTIAIFSDSLCATPVTLEGKSEFTVDVDGVPPVWSAMPTMAWGTLSDATQSALQAFTMTSGVASEFDMSWAFPDGTTGFGEATFCVSGDCGESGSGRLSQVEVRPGAVTAHLPLKAPIHDVAAGDMKTLILGGRDGSGMNMESQFVSCTASQGQGGWCQ